MSICKCCGQERPDSMGCRIVDQRERLGMNQTELARLLGMGQAVLSRIERDQTNISVRVLANLTRALGVSADYLLGGDSE